MRDHASGEMAEWSNAAVLKTVDCNRSGGSNPSFSAKENRKHLVIKFLRFFVFNIIQLLVNVSLITLFLIDYEGEILQRVITFSLLTMPR